jgi:predicted dienelactone hydrolase
MRPNPAEAIWDKEREPQWRDRALDITLILNSLNDLEKNFPELAGKMDHARIGVGGHSYGAFTALQTAGVKTTGSAAAASGDPRVKAVVAMSPQGVSANRGLSAESFHDLRVPAMFMTGSRDFGADQNEGPDWRRTAFENSPAGDKYFVLIRGASHMSFTGVAAGLGEQYEVSREAPIVDPRTGQVLNPGSMQQPQQRGVDFNDRGVFGSIRSTSLMFWDAYLKDNKETRGLLDPSKFSGSVEVTRK